MQKAWDARRELWMLVGLVLLGAGLRFYQLGQESLWFDEAWTALFTQQRGAALREILWNQPFPFYYLLMSGWTELAGWSEVTLRLLSALAGIVSIPLLYRLVAALFTPRAAMAAALLLAISPLHVWYSQEARMYALAAALALAANLAFLAALRRQPGCRTGRRGWWTAYVLLSAGGLHAFYYNALFLVVQGLALFYRMVQERFSSPARRLFSAWLIAQGLILLLFLPGLRVLFTQVQGGTWEWVAAKYGRPSLSALVQAAQSFSLGTTWEGAALGRWAALALFALAFLYGIGRLAVSRERIAFRLDLGFPTLFLLFCLGFPILAIFLFSQFRPGFLLRYLLPFLPYYLAIVGSGVARLRSRSMCVGALVLLVLVCAYSLGGLYAREQKENWRGVAQDIEANLAERDVICVMDEDALPALRYYYRGAAPTIGVSGKLSDSTQVAQTVADLARYERVWLVTSHTTSAALLDYIEKSPAFAPSGVWQYLGVQLALFRLVR